MEVDDCVIISESVSVSGMSLFLGEAWVFFIPGCEFMTSVSGKTLGV